MRNLKLKLKRLNRVRSNRGPRILNVLAWAQSMLLVFSLLILMAGPGCQKSSRAPGKHVPDIPPVRKRSVENGITGMHNTTSCPNPSFCPVITGAGLDLKKLSEKHSTALEHDPIIPILWPIANRDHGSSQGLAHWFPKKPILTAAQFWPFF